MNIEQELSMIDDVLSEQLEILNDLRALYFAMNTKTSDVFKTDRIKIDYITHAIQYNDNRIDTIKQYPYLEQVFNELKKAYNERYTEVEKKA